MPLDTINRIGHAIGQAATAIYRITPVKRSIDSGLAFLQANGHGDSNDATNQELLQENDLDDISHFGFESFPRQNGETEYIVVDADGGEAAIASRRVLPQVLADLAEDEARIYGEEGQSVLCKANGDIEGHPAAGQFFKIPNDATEFAAMANKVLTELQAVKTAFDNHVHDAGTYTNGGGPVTLLSGVPSSAPGTALPMPAPGSVANTTLKIK